MNHRIHLVKLLPEKFESSFLDGRLYLNTNNFFARVDQNDEVRFDAHDGAEMAERVDSLSVLHKGEWLPLPIVGPITYRSKAVEQQNILCLYSMTDRTDDNFDERNQAFGNRAVLILNLKEFLLRVRSAAERIDRPIAHAPIEYVDRLTHEGPLGPFRKYSSYSYQNEFRIVVTGGDGRPLTLEVGDLRDITATVNTIELPSLWKASLQHR